MAWSWLERGQGHITTLPNYYNPLFIIFSLWEFTLLLSMSVPSIYHKWLRLWCSALLFQIQIAKSYHVLYSLLREGAVVGRICPGRGLMYLLYSLYWILCWMPVKWWCPEPPELPFTQGISTLTAPIRMIGKRFSGRLPHARHLTLDVTSWIMPS